MLGPKRFLDGQRRRISGSASASRFVAWSNAARLLRSLATLGWSGPKHFSSMARARRISGSASPSRFVAWSNRGQVVEADGDVGVVRSEALLVDGERAAHQRLGLAKPVRGLEQLGQVVEAAGDVGVVRSEALLVDGQRAAHQRLGLGEPVRGLEQLRQVVEV